MRAPAASCRRGLRPCSVTNQDVVAGRDDACAWRQYGAIFEMPLLVTEGMAMMALPPPFDSDAPYTKSTVRRHRIELRAQRVSRMASWPVMSTCSAVADGRHAVVLRMMGSSVAHVHHQHGRVVVDEVVDALVNPSGNVDTILPFVDVLGFRCYDAALHEREYAVV